MPNTLWNSTTWGCCVQVPFGGWLAGAVLSVQPAGLPVSAVVLVEPPSARLVAGGKLDPRPLKAPIAGESSSI